MRGRAAICILLDAVIAAASIMCVILTWIYVEGFYLQIALTVVWTFSAIGIIGREISCWRKRRKKKETLIDSLHLGRSVGRAFLSYRCIIS